MPRAKIQKKLTPKQTRFVLEYLVDDNAQAASVRAGYAAATKYGDVLKRMPLVKAAVEAARKKRLHKLELTADKVLSDIDRVADLAETAGEYTSALRGRELLGKHLKLFTEKHEHGGIGGGPIPLQITEKEADL